MIGFRNARPVYAHCLHLDLTLPVNSGHLTGILEFYNKIEDLRCGPLEVSLDVIR